MMYLVDGYNVIGAWHHVHLRDPAKESKMVACVLRGLSSSDQAVVYFDGRRSLDTLGARETHGRVSVVYTPAGFSADVCLQRDMSRCVQKNKLRLVTSDKELLLYARSLRIACVSSDAFLRALYQQPDEEGLSKPESMSDLEMGYWERCFQQEGAKDHGRPSSRKLGIYG